VVRVTTKFARFEVEAKSSREGVQKSILRKMPSSAKKKQQDCWQGSCGSNANHGGDQQEREGGDGGGSKEYTSGANQCCQGAEISAAKHKRGRNKLIGAEYLPDLSKKGRKGAELFLQFKTTRFFTEN
jgi:hypothetical protein